MTKADSPAKPSPKLETINLKAFIHCEGCRRKIRRIVRIVDGVEDVLVDSATGKVTVTGTNLDLKAIQQRLQKYGKQAEVWPSANASSNNATGRSAGGNQPKPATINAADTNSKKKNNAAGGNGDDKTLANSSSSESKKGGGKKEEAAQVTYQKGEEGAAASEKKAEKGKPEKSKEPEAGEPSMPQHKGSDGSNGGGGGSGKKGKKGDNGTGNDGFNGGMPDRPPHIALDRPIPSIPIPSTSVAVSANKGPASYDYIQTGYAENNTVDYATHMFSDENANNCSIM